MILWICKNDYWEHQILCKTVVSVLRRGNHVLSIYAILLLSVQKVCPVSTAKMNNYMPKKAVFDR